MKYVRRPQRRISTEKLLARVASYSSPIQSALDRLLPKQLEFVTDPARFKTLVTPRRCGKTWSVCTALLIAALSKTCHCVLIAPYLNWAVRFAWPTLLTAIAELKIRASANNGDRRIVFHDTGSSIELLGADQERYRERLRGEGLELVVIDESGFFLTDLTEFINGVVRPALIKGGSEGKLYLVGTPGYVALGYFFEASTGLVPDFKNFSMTIWDNPYVREQIEGELERQIAANPNFKETALYKREWLGQWVIDTDKLIYPYDENYNALYTWPPPGTTVEQFTYVLGIDYGCSPDPSAWVLGAYDLNYARTLFVIDARKELGLFEEDIIRITRGYVEQYNPTKVVVDVTYKPTTEYMRQRLRWPVEVARKDPGKRNYWISTLASDIAHGHVKFLLPQCTPLVKEMQGYSWKFDKQQRLMPDQNAECDTLDACRYMYTWAYNFLFQEAEPEAPPLTLAEAIEKQEQEEFERAVMESSDYDRNWKRKRRSVFR